ncbi:glucose 1-dehydrogenase [Diplodia corticola]|uniref:Glucose 1-dehydrogenase n=1 Tax=Diplodia corticola TaxID=236234 RepID=A0A1J9S0B6_9PEZI|nr:glucose 1-dehydrogenase [Diplodia corticola]OJD33468.1 glucose 1-dehydrogenase [Diplodia corticola]
MPLSLNLEDTHVLITGGAGLIGLAVARAFLSEGAHVSSLDIAYNPPPDLSSDDEEEEEDRETDYTGPGTLHEYHADVADEASLARAWRRAVAENGPVACCVALAGLDLSVLRQAGAAGAAASTSSSSPSSSSEGEGSVDGGNGGGGGGGGVVDVSVARFRRTLDVNVVGAFLTARQWLRGIRDAEGSWEYLENACLVLVGSESAWWGERGGADYAAAKSAVQGGLMKSLAAEAPRVYGKARVNAVAPGPVDTARFRQECAANPEQLWLDAQATTGLGKPVPVEAVARSILFLSSDTFSSHVHGQVLNVDSGKQGKVLWPKEDIADLESSSQSETSEED